MVIFNSYVSLPEGTPFSRQCFTGYYSKPTGWISGPHRCAMFAICFMRIQPPIHDKPNEPSVCWSVVSWSLVHPLKKAPPYCILLLGGSPNWGLLEASSCCAAGPCGPWSMGLFGGDRYGYRTCMNMLNN